MSNVTGNRLGQAYLGVTASNPPNMIIESRYPDFYDINYELGDLWLHSYESLGVGTHDVYMLVDLSGDSNSRGQKAEWALIGSGTGAFDSLRTGTGVVVLPSGGTIDIVGDGVNIFTDSTVPNQLKITYQGQPGELFQTNAGIATPLPATGILNVYGGRNTNTAATGIPADTVIINLNEDVDVTGYISAGNGLYAVAGGLDVTGDVVFNDLTSGLLRADGTGKLAVSAPAAVSGQIPISDGAGGFTWGTITPGGTVTVTNGPGAAITLGGGGGAGGTTSFSTDIGGPAVPTAGGVINLKGYTHIIKTDGSTANTVKVGLEEHAQCDIPMARGIGFTTEWGTIVGAGTVAVSYGDRVITITGGAAGGTGGITSINADPGHGSAAERLPEQDINIVGFTNETETWATGVNTLEISLSSTLVTPGTLTVTGATVLNSTFQITPLNHVGLLKTDGTGLVSSLAPGAAGTIPVSDGAGGITWATITQGVGSVTVTNGPGGTITIGGGGGVGSGTVYFDTNSGYATCGISIHPSPSININGGVNMNTAGGTNTVIVNLNKAIYLPLTTITGLGEANQGIIAIADGPVGSVAADRFLHNFSTIQLPPTNTAASNTFVGHASGNLTTVSSTHNTGCGTSTLFGLTSGDHNTAIGAVSQYALTTGSNNTACGSYGLRKVTTGSTNTAIGSYSLYENLTNSNSTAVGYRSQYNAKADGNVSVGANSLYTATTAAGCTAIGTNAMNLLTTGTYNVAVGESTLAAAVTSTASTAVGYQALQVATSNYNTAVGHMAMQATTTGFGNTSMGYYAMNNATDADYNVAIGYGAIGSGVLTSAGDFNVAVGYRALYTATSAKDNTAIGHSAMYTATTGDYNVAIGGVTGDTPSEPAALGTLTTGSYNTAVGNGALGNISSGIENTALGYKAGSALTLASHDNLMLENEGIVGDVHTTRIGSPSKTSCYANGIYNRADGAAPRVVMCGSDGKLSTSSSGYNSPYAPGGVVLAARMVSDLHSVTGDQTVYYLGTAVGGVAKPMSSYVNRGGGTYTAGGVGTPAQYTVPVSGVYLLTFNCRLNGIRGAIIPAPPPPAPVVSYDPICIETSASGIFSYFPTLTYNGYQEYTSSAITAVAYLAAGSTVKWYIQIDYRPGDSGDYSPTGMRKEIGIDGSDGASNYFTFVGLSLLNAY